MARHLLLVFTNPEEGREEEFNTWYDDIHLPEVLEVDGFTAAQRLVASPGARGELPAQQYLAIYEVETDDLPAAIEALRQASRHMKISTSMSADSVVTYAFSAVTARRTQTSTTK